MAGNKPGAKKKDVHKVRVVFYTSELNVAQLGGMQQLRARCDDLCERLAAAKKDGQKSIKIII